MSNQAPSTEKKKTTNTRQYVLIAIILLLLGMGILMISKSLAHKNNQTAEIPTVESTIQEENLPEDETLNDIIDKQDVDFDDESTDNEVETQGADDSKLTTIIENPKIEKNTSPTTTIINEEPKMPKPNSKYMVLTGSFGSIENARKRLEQTISAGYRDAEIVQFDDSKYHTVCALRTNDLSSAETAVKKLKHKKIDALVHRQRLKK
ncbi:MAG TPA: SPOR domain-containing protein [Saprospiraceae bacterium]|nr:SPOR domain-containing protein [Saprospiraceae bacterium]